MIIAMPGLDGGRVLLLEDEVFIAIAIRKFLAAAGAIDIFQAHTAEDALDLVKSTDLDAAVLDVSLAGGTSFDVATELTEQGVAIVFHSGQESCEFADAFPKAVFCAKLDGPGLLVEALVQAKKNLEAA